MSVLDQVIQMKNQGISDEEITTTLKEQRISPRDIHDALSQAKIKSAVSNEEEMQHSIMETPPTPNEEDVYVPQTQEPEQEEQPQQEYYPQEGYTDYSAPIGTDTDTMIEIAEQVFSEKMQKIQNHLEKLNEFQTLSQVKMDSTAERLKRIETIMDNLQISILDRVGSYGKNLDNIKKEMSMMQDSFRKIPKQATSQITKKISKK